MSDESGKFDVRKLRDKEGVEAGTGFTLLSLGMGLDRRQQQIILRTLWVLIVTTHILWVCGLLVPVGLSAPFARADTVEELTRTASISARLQLTTELRVQTIYWCAAKDPTQKQGFEQTIDRLHEEYRRVTKGESPPTFRCAGGEAP